MARSDGKRSPKRTLTDEWIRENLTYEPDTGLVRRRGQVVGNPDSKGYLRTQLRGNFMRIHRLAWFLANGSWPVHQIDHIDGDKQNNRLSNLRDVPVEVNIQNRRHATGVCREGARFAAVIVTGGRKIRLGSFNTHAEANASYVAARPLLHAGYTEI
ncbi:HNH endonuclease [Stenotrophomonas maltophilia]|uniref:HNH endonuclease n=1 Tax=Stenotrophomonas maltophilia TaxID=40324 RepID=UPI0013DB4ED1